MEEKGSQGVGITQKQKMSLESDQDAPENEFEQIKDEDYVDEVDDEQDERY